MNFLRNLLICAGVLCGPGLALAVDPAPTFPVTQITSPWVTSAAQSGTWTVMQGSPPWSVSQSGTWTTGRTWTLSDPSDTVKSDQGTAASLSGAWPIKLTDGTNTHPTADVPSRAAFTKITDGTNTGAVTAASTAAATTDPAQVVNISPNSPMPFSDRLITGNITTACSSGISCAGTSMVVIQTSGAATIGYETHGTWVGTITTDVSYDNSCFSSPGAANWYQTGSIDTDVNQSQYLVSWTQANNNDPWIMPIAGAQCARVRASALSSGTVNVSLDASTGAASAWDVPVGNVAHGATDIGNPIKIGGKYNSTAPSISDGQRGDAQLDSKANLLTSLERWAINRQDISTTVSSSGTSSSFDTAGLAALSNTFQITAISGTGATIQFYVQVSDDNTNFATTASLPQTTVTGAQLMGSLRILHKYYRYGWIVSGSSPSITFTTQTTLKPVQTEPARVIYNYADLNLTVNGNTSSAFGSGGCKNISVVFVRGATSGNSNVQVFGSNDQVNWVTQSSNVAVNPSTVNAITLSNLAFRYYEAQVITHATSGTADLQWSCN